MGLQHRLGRPQSPAGSRGAPASLPHAFPAHRPGPPKLACSLFTNSDESSCATSCLYTRVFIPRPLHKAAPTLIERAKGRCVQGQAAGDGTWRRAGGGAAGAGRRVSAAKGLCSSGTCGPLGRPRGTLLPSVLRVASPPASWRPVCGARAPAHHGGRAGPRDQHRFGEDARSARRVLFFPFSLKVFFPAQCDVF